jgi:RNAse (barnase) inhibitor barstar
MPMFDIDGERISTLEDFYDEIERVLIPGVTWGRNLDALNDLLRGGFGTPPGGFLLRWTRHAVSRERLGYSETVRVLERRMQTCHPESRRHVGRELEAARAGVGDTIFDSVVRIIRDHGPGGAESTDGVSLVLE